jgi:hypothetical protein
MAACYAPAPTRGAAWVVEAPDAETVYSGLLFYRPHDDGLVIVPYGEPRVERNATCAM